jgi:hypothetical protein
VLDALAQLVKQALVARLEVVNIAADPAEARRLGVRSVPWTRIGEFDLPGAHTPTELRRWAEQSGTEAGMARYFDERLREGRRDTVQAMVREEPPRAAALVALLLDPRTGIHTRLGVMATLEELTGSPVLAGLVDRLGEGACAGEPRIRVDALHALTLTRGRAALAYARQCLADADPGVREAAREAVEVLQPMFEAVGEGP